MLVYVWLWCRGSYFPGSRFLAQSNTSEWWCCLGGEQCFRYTCVTRWGKVGVALGSEAANASILWKARPRRSEAVSGSVPEGVATIDVCAGYWTARSNGPGELEERSELSSLASIYCDYDRLWKACSVVSDSVLYSIAVLLHLTIVNVDRISRLYLREMCIGAFESPLSSNSSCIGEVELQLSSCDKGLATSERNASSNECCLRFAEDAVGGLHDQVQVHVPQLREAKLRCAYSCWVSP